MKNYNNGRWTFPMFLHVVWEMTGRKGHFAMEFRPKYEKTLKEIWKKEK